LPQGPHSEPQLDLDVAIVGGGVSGLYAAWRLLREATKSPVLQALASRRSDGRLRIAVFECSDRFGGRLLSMRLPGVPHLPVELGGMRFLSTHRRVNGLVQHFGLTHRELRVTDPDKKNLYYLRGRHFAAADWDRPSFVPPYRLERGERGRSPGELLLEVALRYRTRAEQMRDIGFWNLLLDEYSEEAYRLIKEAGGYDSIVGNWSTAEAVPFLLADFDPAFRYFALNDGFQMLPLKLADHVSRAGGGCYLKHRLHRLDRDGDNVRLTFDCADTSRFRFRNVEMPRSCTARHVFLAMPRRSLECLHPDSFLFKSEQFQDDLTAVLIQPALKIFAAYRRPWWTTARGIREGRSVTDLPMRQCYYWGTEETAPNGDVGNLNSILMASYNDGSSVEFWAGLARHPERYKPPAEAFPPGVAIPDASHDRSASARLVEELQDQLRELHGLGGVRDSGASQIAAPYLTVYQDWTQDPFGGGWHFWKIGVDARHVMQRMRQPIPGVALYVCGEAWSRQQGWVEGALETTDSVLNEHFGLDSLAFPETHRMARLLGGSAPSESLTGADFWSDARFR
jgi:monoamine oxidase